MVRLSNECRKVIMQHSKDYSVNTEICRLLEENNFISCQALTYVGRGAVTVLFLPDHNTQADMHR